MQLNLQLNKSMMSQKKKALVVAGALFIAFAILNSCAGSKKGAVPCPSYKKHPHHTGYQIHPVRNAAFQVHALC
jgi:hypothetical protein